MSDLKCPWCGSDCSIVTIEERYYFFCRNGVCLSAGPYCETEQQAIESTKRFMKTERDWEQVRIDAAIAAINGLLSQGDFKPGSCAADSVEYADALVKKLRGET